MSRADWKQPNVRDNRGEDDELKPGPGNDENDDPELPAAFGPRQGNHAGRRAVGEAVGERRLEQAPGFTAGTVGVVRDRVKDPKLRPTEPTSSATQKKTRTQE